MKNKTRLFGGLIVGVAALAFSSCAYDPYYSGGSSYTTTSVGYGHGYGYGGSNFSTSVFVSTGSPRWGYDPYCGAYYDYTRRSYYDPYLYAYYPVGYRPAYIRGAPHPHGWRYGQSRIAPPSRVTNVTVNNYRNREHAYRNLDRSWSREVRAEPPARPGSYGRGGARGQDPRAGQHQHSQGRTGQHSAPQQRDRSGFGSNQWTNTRPEPAPVQTQRDTRGRRDVTPQPTFQQPRVQTQRDNRGDRDSSFRPQASPPQPPVQNQRDSRGRQSFTPPQAPPSVPQQRDSRGSQGFTQPQAPAPVPNQRDSRGRRDVTPPQPRAQPAPQAPPRGGFQRGDGGGQRGSGEGRGRVRGLGEG